MHIFLSLFGMNGANLTQLARKDNLIIDFVLKMLFLRKKEHQAELSKMWQSKIRIKQEISKNSLCSQTNTDHQCSENQVKVKVYV